MTQAQQILDYLWSIAPAGATNRQIAEALGIRSHQTVYMATQDLTLRRRIRGEQIGKTWYFHALDAPELEFAHPLSTTIDAQQSGNIVSPADFEQRARLAMYPKNSILFRWMDRLLAMPNTTLASAAWACPRPNSQSLPSMFGCWKKQGRGKNSWSLATTAKHRFAG